MTLVAETEETLSSLPIMGNKFWASMVPALRLNVPTRLLKTTGRQNLAFVELNFTQELLCESFALEYLRDWDGAVLYGRSFLHAITECAEDNLLNVMKRLANKTGRICFEFRTERDVHLFKVTGPHYRRFIDPLSIIERFAKLGLRTSYFCEGNGFAKYKNDDAYVARLIVEST